MNKSYKSVWNESTGTYVAASEVAKSGGKKSRNQKALVAALLAAGVGFGTAVKAEAAATPNSFAAGILGTNTTNSDCISSADGAVVSTGTDCSAPAQEAGIVSYNASGNAGAYFTVTDPTTAHIGAGGVDQMKITNSGVFVMNTLDMGGKKISNLAAGAVSASSTDAVNGSQLFALTNGSTVVNSAYVQVGGKNDGTDKASAALPTDIAIGSGATAGMWSSSGLGVAIGTNASAANGAGVDGTAIGANARAASGTAIGMNSFGGGVSGAALGSYSFALNGGTALGAYATASGANSVAIGYNSSATIDNTVSVGSSTVQRQIVNVARGNQATDAVNYGQLQAAGLKVDSSGNATNSFVTYDDTTLGKATLGGASGTTLANVGAGALSASSMDAVNGSQLYTTNQNVDANKAAVVQITSDIATNKSNIAQNTSDITKNAGNITNIDSRVTNVEGSVSTITNQINSGELGLVQQDQTSRNLTVGATTNGLQINMAGTAGNRVVTGMAAGAVSASSVDAVNGSQLYTTNQSVAQNTSDISVINSQIASLGGGVASAVTYDSSALDTVTLSGVSGTTLTNLKAGALSASSMDAVNGSQLYTTNQNVAASTAAIAQNTSDIATNKSVIAQNTSDITKNAGDITNIDSRVTNVEGSVSTITNQINSGELGLVQQDPSSRNLTVGATTDGLQVSMAGTAGNRVVTGVAAGAVSASSVDAVNGSQLYTTNQAVTQNTTDIEKNTGDITKIDARVTNVEGTVTNLTTQLNSGAVGLVQQDPTSGALTVASSTGGASVDFTGTTGPRELLGVSAGRTATSAVNLGQLSPVVASLGGGAQVNADGSITSPTYHMQGGTQTTVGGALDTLDTNLSSLESQISNGGIGIVTQDQTSRDINVGSSTDGLRVNMAGTAGNRMVTGVAPGAVSASSVDAVNGGQLYAHAASTAAALGGGSTVNADGTVSAPSYSVGGTTVNNVGAAVSNLDGRVTQNTSDIASLQTTVGTMSGSVANAVSYDSSAHDKVTMGGSASAPAVKLTNLQQGEVSASSTDAVTGAQLWDTNQQLSNLTQSVQNQQQTGSSSISSNSGNQPAATAAGNNAIALGGGASASGDNSAAIGAGSVADQANTVSVGSQGNERRITNVANATSATDAVNLGQMQSSIGDVARAAYGGVAAATALTMIPEVDPGKTLAVGVAGGTFKGYQATAVGVSARITQNLKVKAGVGMSPGETTAGIGASYQW